jgi:oxygen-dependent protoporphyrinogen oxidase
VLAARGATCVLLEAEDRAGGVVRTEHEGGFVLDAGPDSMLSQKPEGQALCHDLGLTDEVIPTSPDVRTVYVLHAGALHPMPEGMVLGVPTRPWSLLTSGLFTWRGKLRMALEPLVPRRRAAGDESIASFLSRRLGGEALRRLGDPLLGGIHAGDPERLSIRATFPRLVDLEARHGGLVRGMRGSLKGPRGAAFVSLRGGMGVLAAAAADALPSGCLRLREPVAQIDRDGAGFTVRSAAAAYRARAVILALPAHRAAGLVAPIDEDAGRLLGGIPFASTATVLLGFRRGDVAHPLDGYGLVIPRSEGRRLLACTFVSTKLAGRAPAGHVLLRGFLGGVRDPDVLARDDQAHVRTMLEEMGPLLGLRGAPVLARVFRFPRSTPQMEVGHEERVAALDAALGATPGLLVTGGGLRGTGIPDVIGDAERTAEMARMHCVASG